MNREKAFREFWRARHGVSVVGKVGAKNAFNAALDLMDKEIAGVKRMAQTMLECEADATERAENQVTRHLAEVVKIHEAEIERLKAQIEVLAVDAATLNAALIDIINGKMEKQSAILLPDYEAYDSDEKKREWAKSEALKRMQSLNTGEMLDRERNHECGR